MIVLRKLGSSKILLYYSNLKLRRQRRTESQVCEREDHRQGEKAGRRTGTNLPMPVLPWGGGAARVSSFNLIFVDQGSRRKGRSG